MPAILLALPLPSRSRIVGVIFKVGGPFPGRERTVRPEYKDSIFNRIAASEGASHGSETGLSSATSSPPLWLTGSSVSFLNDPAQPGDGLG